MSSIGGCSGGFRSVAKELSVVLDGSASCESGLYSGETASIVDAADVVDLHLKYPVNLVEASEIASLMARGEIRAWVVSSTKLLLILLTWDEVVS
jgi:hypothetical protein